MAAQFTVLPRQFPGATKKNYEIPQSRSRSLGRDLNPGPPKYEAEVNSATKGNIFFLFCRVKWGKRTRLVGTCTVLYL
jgi:hypothetical protein